MTASIVLLAGTGWAAADGLDGWTAALAASGLTAEQLWLPETSSGAAIELGRSLAQRLGIELEVSPAPTTAAMGAIVGLRGGELTGAAAFAADRGIPMLVDRPGLDTTQQLEDLAEVAGSLPIVSGYHYTDHPGLTRALAAIRSGELGLLRAVACDLVLAGEQSSHSVDALREPGMAAVEIVRAATGAATLRVQGHGSPNGTSWTFLGQTERDVVVSAHVSRLLVEAGSSGTLRASVRLVGTHGSSLVDLTAPALELRTPAQTSTLPFGEASMTARLRRFGVLAGGAKVGPTAHELVVVSQALDAIAASSRERQATSLTW